MLSKQNLSLKMLRLNIILGLKSLDPENCGSKKIKACLQNIGYKNFGQNLDSNRLDIPDIVKSCQEKCCLDKCQCDSWRLWKTVPGIYP